jgi:hypothetical protein
VNRIVPFFKNTKIGKAILLILGIMLVSILEEAYDLNQQLSIPFQALSHWSAEGAFAGRIKFVILLLIYTMPVISLWVIISANFKSEEDSEESVPFYQSRFDYDKMIAELVQAVGESTITDQVKADKVTILFDSLLTDICELYQLQRNDLRAVITYNDGGSEKLTSWRWGRLTTSDQDRMDLKAIGTLLETELTYPTWEETKKKYPNSDSDTLFFIRNRGGLKLGCLIASANAVNTQSRIAEWSQIVYPFTMLGHMDNLVRFVVNYR